MRGPGVYHYALTFLQSLCLVLGEMIGPQFLVLKKVLILFSVLKQKKLLLLLHFLEKLSMTQNKLTIQHQRFQSLYLKNPLLNLASTELHVCKCHMFVDHPMYILQP